MLFLWDFALVEQGDKRRTYYVARNDSIVEFVDTISSWDYDELQQAIWLMRLSYLQKTSQPKSVDATELARMSLSEAVQQATLPHF